MKTVVKWAFMCPLLLAGVLCMVAMNGERLVAQDAVKPVIAPATLPPVTVAELISAHRQTWASWRQRVADHEAILVATTEYKAFIAIREQFQQVEAELGKLIAAKTGKTIVWATGELK